MKCLVEEMSFSLLLERSERWCISTEIRRQRVPDSWHEETERALTEGFQVTFWNFERTAEGCKMVHRYKDTKKGRPTARNRLRDTRTHTRMHTHTQRNTPIIRNVQEHIINPNDAKLFCQLHFILEVICYQIYITKYTFCTLLCQLQT